MCMIRIDRLFVWFAFAVGLLFSGSALSGLFPHYAVVLKIVIAVGIITSILWPLDISGLPSSPEPSDKNQPGGD